MLFLVEAVLSGYFGYQRRPWWVPATLACGFVLLQLLFYSMTVGPWRREDGLSTQPILVLLLNGLTWNLIVAYVSFAIGFLVSRWRTGSTPSN